MYVKNTVTPNLTFHENTSVFFWTLHNTLPTGSSEKCYVFYYCEKKKKKKAVCETAQVNWISKTLGTILLAPTARIPTIFDRYFI